MKENIYSLVIISILRLHTISASFILVLGFPIRTCNIVFSILADFLCIYLKCILQLYPTVSLLLKVVLYLKHEMYGIICKIYSNFYVNSSLYKFHYICVLFDIKLKPETSKILKIVSISITLTFIRHTTFVLHLQAMSIVLNYRNGIICSPF